VVTVGEHVVPHGPTRPRVSLRDGPECLAVHISCIRAAALTTVSPTATTGRDPTQQAF
jgi:hypothetical protein